MKELQAIRQDGRTVGRERVCPDKQDFRLE